MKLGVGVFLAAISAVACGSEAIAPGDSAIRWVAASAGTCAEGSRWTSAGIGTSAMRFDGTGFDKLTVRLPVAAGEQLASWHVDWQSTDSVPGGAYFVRQDAAGTHPIESGEAYVMHTVFDGKNIATQRIVTDQRADGEIDGASEYTVVLSPAMPGATPGALTVWRVGVSVLPMGE